MVNLELYRVFYTVAKCGYLTKAAQELYISQPAVSQSIKQLESRLGVALFNRTHKGMELSASAGRLIFQKVEEALTALEAAENSISELRNSPTGTVRIGATDSIFSYLLVDEISEFKQKYPTVKLELISATSPEILSRLKEGGCDIAFLNLPVDDEEIRFVGRVGVLSDIFVAGKGYENLKDITLPLKSLKDYPLLMIEENTVARRAMAEFCRGNGVNLTPDTEFSNWDLMAKFAAKGMGIGCVPREYCLNLLESGELFEVKTSPSLPVRGVGVALHKNAPVSFALKMFISLFE